MSYIIYQKHQLKEFIQSETSIVVLMDENTEKYCYPLLKEILPEHHSIVIPSGEIYKNLETVSSVIHKMIRHQAGRETLLINLGGGVVTDLGGFIADIYKRGIRYIQIPTSLLAMVDAAIGGKTGVDIGAYKNMAGTFSEPDLIYIQSYFLHTLDEKQIRSGFAEMLKHGLIADAEYWKKLSTMDLNDIGTEEIIQSIHIKNSIVNEDPMEEGERKKLNFGHTYGHAIESYFLETGHPILHGEAIALGMLWESELSVNYAKLSHQTYIEIESILNSFYSDIISIAPSKKELLKYLLNDKKNMESNINFTLLNQIGDSQIDFLLSIKESI